MALISKWSRTKVLNGTKKTCFAGKEHTSKPTWEANYEVYSNSLGGNNLKAEIIVPCFGYIQTKYTLVNTLPPHLSAVD